MQALGIVAPEPAPITESMVSVLQDRGRVGVVRATDVGTTTASGVATEYEVGDTGWRGSGDERSITEVLDRLARDHEYAIVVGFPGIRIPQLVVGETEVRQELERVNSPAAVDPDAVADRLDEVLGYESLASLVAKAKRAEGSEFAGAIATFTGRVRAREGPDDDRTEYLEFERYDGVAADRMERIRSELQDRDGVEEVLLHHRTGVIEAGEDIVFVVVLAGHRREAFETVEAGIDRLKDEVPIFKKEVTVGETFWVHNRE